MSKVAYLFPGQASQAVGMGKDLVDAFDESRALFEDARETLGLDLPRLCFEGPLEELTETRNAQPAILLHSLAVHAVLAARLDLRPAFVAGHSLGEFSAAAAAGALSVEDALRVVRRRGELMFAAGQEAPGTMAAVIGLDPDACVGACREASEAGPGTVVVANLNSPAQVVVSGDVEAVARAEATLKAAGAKRVLPLKVSGAFHSPLMEVVQGDFREFLAGIDFADPACPVVANVGARPVGEAAALREGFVEQLVSPVRWHESIEWLVEQGVTDFVELGPGNVLSNLGARSFRSASFHSTSDAEGVQKVLATLGG